MTLPESVAAVGSTAEKPLTGAEMVVEVLRQECVDVIFGYPGGAVLPLYDALYQCGIRHILARHEQGAIHAAEGYARVTGKPGVVIATSGPGATNIVTGLADAMLDSLPIVAITGQVSTAVIGTDAFQETSIIGISTPITKHNYQVRTVEELPTVLKEAFHIACTGRPGPVLIDIPKDIAAKTADFNYDSPVDLPGYQPTMNPNPHQIRKLKDALQSSSKPVILAGAGVIHARAEKELREFAEQFEIPVVNTLLGLGSFPASHSLHMGMGGMHGTYAANQALTESDLLINVGARFDDRLTGDPASFARNAVVAHIDIDPAEIGKNIRTHIPIVADAARALQPMKEFEVGSARFTEWNAYLQGLKKEYPLWFHPSVDGALKPQEAIHIVWQETLGDAIVVTDVGQHQMWTAQFYPFCEVRRLVTSGGLGTMGFGLPAAIGAELANSGKRVVALLGDAGFQMTLQELALLAEYQLPVITVIVNNHSLGMVRQWQELFYEKRYSESLLPKQPDYVKLADAYGIRGVRVETEAAFRSVLQESLGTNEPIVIDCHVDGQENVYPMVPPGRGIHEMVGVTPK